MWKEKFQEILPLLGHRNWILVVDKAYPLQSATGMTYINSGEPLENALSYVLSSIDSASHIKPIIYTDKELEYLTHFGEKEAQVAFLLDSLLRVRDTKSILHDDIFTKIDSASKLFSIVVIKTESTVAYSSVFIELDCGYWTSDKEQQLRNLL